MSKRSMVTGLVIVVFLATVWVGRALSQEARQRPEGERGARRVRRGDREGMRQRFMERYLERIKETLQATDEEWTVLKPRIEKVQTLSQQANVGGGMRMLFARRARRAGTPEGGEAAEPAPELSAVEKAIQDLQTVLANEQATPEEIAAKLTALREAREKANQELAKAQEGLRGLLAVRQEAQLVLMGLLD